MRRIGFDARAGVLVIMGNGVFPAESLMVSDAGEGRFQIWSLAGRAEQLVGWDDVATLDGECFASADAARAYLLAEFAKRPSVGQPPLTFTAGEPLSGHRAVRLAGSGAVRVASSDDIAQAGLVAGVTLHAAEEGEPVAVAIVGEVVEPSWSFAPGPVLLGLNGALVQAPPASGFVQSMGTAITPTRLIVVLSEPYILAT